MEPSGFERAGTPVRWRRKGGLETPLVGRFGREGRRLVFAPPAWYDALVALTLGFGLFLIVRGLFGAGFAIFFTPLHALAFGTAVFLAGVWAVFSNERILFDLTKRTYVRLEGSGLAKRVTRGNLSDLDALQLLAETPASFVPFDHPVVYRLVLHWKGRREPLLVVEREDRRLSGGAPTNQAAGAILQRAVRYSQALGVPLYDNSYYSSPGPVPVV